MRYLVTGGAGFIGSNLVDRLLADGHSVIVYDNFSTGQERFLTSAITNKQFTLYRGDLLDFDSLCQALSGIDFVFHLAANADVRFGLEHPRKDLEQNTIGTFNVLEAMRLNDVRSLAFSSTGSVYGEPNEFPTPEHTRFPVQTSLYGASKVAGEALIQAYCEGYGFRCFIFRFVSILGERYSHGHVFDFYKSLLRNPATLTILGDGQQRKSYLYIGDCIEAIMTAIEKSSDRINIFNLGTDEYCKVEDSVSWMCDHLGLSPEITHTGGTRGWIGDNPFIFLDCSKIHKLGWVPRLSIHEGIIATLKYLQLNPWLLELRQ